MWNSEYHLIRFRAAHDDVDMDLAATVGTMALEPSEPSKTKESACTDMIADINNDPILPPKNNQNKRKSNEDLINEVKEIYGSITIDIEETLNNYIKSGRRLSQIQSQ